MSFQQNATARSTPGQPSGVSSFIFVVLLVAGFWWFDVWHSIFPPSFDVNIEAQRQQLDVGDEFSLATPAQFCSDTQSCETFPVGKDLVVVRDAASPNGLTVHPAFAASSWYVYRP